MSDIDLTAIVLSGALKTSTVVQEARPYAYADDNCIVIGHDDELPESYHGEVNVLDVLKDAEVSPFDIRWEDDDLPILLTAYDADVLRNEVSHYFAEHGGETNED